MDVFRVKACLTTRKWASLNSREEYAYQRYAQLNPRLLITDGTILSVSRCVVHRCHSLVLLTSPFLFYYCNIVNKLLNMSRSALRIFSCKYWNRWMTNGEQKLTLRNRKESTLSPPKRESSANHFFTVFLRLIKFTWQQMATSKKFIINDENHATKEKNTIAYY